MIVICGPTSSGKTGLAIKLAKEFGLEIISADSRQIYKYMDIGTGKMPIDLNDISIEKHDDFWIIDGVKIWMYDVCEPGEYFSVIDWKNKVQNLTQNSDKFLIVGGTGLYIESLINKNFNPTAEPDWELREELAQKNLQELQDLVSKTAFENLNESDRNNPTRLIRLIEKEASGIEIKSSAPEYDPNYKLIYLHSENEFLFNRVDKWVDSVCVSTIEETKSLIAKGYKNSPQLNGIIYRDIAELIDNNDNIEETKQKIKFDLHAYIRRQKTWFNRYEFAEKFDISDNKFDSAVRLTVSLNLNERRK